MTSISFLEVDTTSEMVIINQDSSYFTTNLTDGSVVTFTSISNQLDDTLPIQNQMEYVPGGIVLVLYGYDEDDNYVQNTVSWAFGGEGHCDSEPLSDGDTIGWIQLVSF